MDGLVVSAGIQTNEVLTSFFAYAKLCGSENSFSNNSSAKRASKTMERHTSSQGNLRHDKSVVVAVISTLFTSVLTTCIILVVAMGGKYLGAEEPCFLGDFEHGVMPLTLENPDSPWYLHGNSPEVVTAPDPVRHGRFAMKSVLDREKSSNSFRTEVISRIDDKRNHPKLGQDYWYGFSIYFPNDWDEDSIWEIVAQWHGVPDKHLGEVSRNPVMAFYSDGSKLKITNIWDAAPNTQAAQKQRRERYDGGVTLWEGPLRKGQWTDWVVHVIWSYESNGFVEIWENGIRVANRKGPNTFNDQKAPYFKMGIYKGWRDREKPAGKIRRRVLYHDEVRFAGPTGNYDSVAPRSE